jgi:lysophospholipase L1-like esterase
VRAYNSCAAKIASRHGIRVNDLYQVVMDAGRDELLTQDGVHFAAQGYALLGNAVADAIRALI